jgi:hypothetical protein
VHVTIGANPWISKQVPGATNGVSPLKDHIGLGRAITLKKIPSSNSRDACTDNNNVKMFHLGRLEQ